MQAKRSLFGLVAAFLVNAALSTAFAAEAPATFNVSEFTFARPAAWEWVQPNSPMRKAQLSVPGKEGKGTIIFFSFGPGQGGGVKANIDRWLGQFEEPREKLNAKTEDVTVGGRKVSYVQAQGTYLDGMPGGPKTPLKNHGLLGAILESEQGSVFIRMTGPVALVEASRSEFKKMVESGLKK